MDRNDPVIRNLLEGNEEFRNLFQEHETLEGKLAALDSMHYLSPQQEMERRQMQKMKLRGRDRMEEIMHQVRGGQARQ